MLYWHANCIIPNLIPPTHTLLAQNILLTADGTVQLADFGAAIDISAERPLTRAGTLEYMVRVGYERGRRGDRGGEVRAHGVGWGVVQGTVGPEGQGRCHKDQCGGGSFHESRHA